jgi:hypothetical protein
MNSFVKTHAAKTVTAVTAVSAGTTVALNAQKLKLSEAWHEALWCSELLAVLAVFIAALAALVLVAARGRRLLLNHDRSVRLMCMAAFLVLISTGLSLSGWVVAQVGLLQWAIVQSAILVHLAIPFYLLRFGWQQRTVEKWACNPVVQVKHTHDAPASRFLEGEGYAVGVVGMAQGHKEETCCKEDDYECENSVTLGNTMGENGDILPEIAVWESEGGTVLRDDD